MTTTPLLSALERQALSQALTRDHEAFLRPGERVRVEGNQEHDAVSPTLRITTADRAFHLQLEAALHHGDNPTGRRGKEAFAAIMEFLRLQLYEFFRLDRGVRFPLEFKPIEYDGALFRFRGERSNPALEAQADALLDGAEA